MRLRCAIGMLLGWAGGFLSVGAEPVNDDWTGAIDLGDGIAVWGHGSNVGAVREAFEAPDGTGSVWWRWTARRSGDVFVSSRFVNGNEVKVGVYREVAGGIPEKVALKSLQYYARQWLWGFRAEAGTSYLISIGGSYDVGEIVVDVEWFERLPNEDFGGRIAVSGSGFPEISVPWHTLGPLWWEWVPDRDQAVFVEGDRVRVVVYRGGEREDLEEVVGGASFFLAARAGEHYCIALEPDSRWWNKHGEGRAVFKVLEAPANGRFASRADLGAVAALEWEANNVLADAEDGEPEHDGEPVGHSLWYAWTAPESGFYAIDAEEYDPKHYGGFGVALGIYRGDAPGELETVAEGTKRVVFSASAGGRFVVRAASGQDAAGRISFSLAPLPAANDDFADRILLETPTFILEGDTGLAGMEPGEPNPGRRGPEATRTLWWEWVAPDGRAVDFRRRIGRAGLAFYTTDAESPGLGDLMSIPRGRGWLTPEPGRRYFFQVYTGDNAPNGDRFLYQCDHMMRFDGFVNPVPPANDDFEARIDLGNRVGVGAEGDVYGATDDSSRPDSRPSRGAGSIWWRWTAPYSGVFGIRREGGASGDRVSVYQGSEPGGLKLVASGTTQGETIWFAAEGGKSYAVMWMAYWKSRKDSPERYVAFGVVAGRVPENDLFARARELPPGFGHRVAGCNAGAGVEPGEPDHGGRPAKESVWFRWVAPVSGPVVMATQGRGLRSGVYVWHGWSELRRVAGGQWTVFFDAEAGMTYWLAVDSDLPESFQVWMDEAAPAPNDEFDDALVLRGSSADVKASTYGAGFQNGEPHEPWQTGGMVWWRWTAPASAPVKIWLSGTTRHGFSVFLGDSPSALEPMVEKTRSFRFFAEAGEEYRIGVLDTYSSGIRSFELHLEQDLAGPANDAFAAAQEIQGAEAEVSGTLAGASLETWEFSGWYYGNHSVWYRWEVPGDGSAIVRAVEGVPVWLAAYRGADSQSLERIGAGESRMGVLAHAGETLWIRVAAQSSRELGPFELQVKWLGYAENDGFSEGIDLGAVDSAVVEAAMAGSSREEGEPYYYGKIWETGSLWWRWTAPKDCGVFLDLRGGRFYPEIIVYRGDSLENLVRVAPLNSQRTTRDKCLWFRAEAGVEYRISAVSRLRRDSVGDFRMELTTEPVANDDFADRIRLPAALPAASEVLASGAGREAGEAWNARSLWWEWTAAESGWVFANFGGSTISATPRVMTGERLARLSEIPCEWMGNGDWCFRAEVGVRYLIWADLRCQPKRGVPGLVRLALRPAGFDVDALVPPNDTCARALPLSGEQASIRVPRHRTLDDGNDPEMNRRGSLWWSWTAPHSGILKISLGERDWAVLYAGEEPERLLEAERMEDANGVRSYRVEAGRSYRLAAGDRDAGEIRIDLELEPPPAYRRWSRLYFQPGETGNAPSADPDHDGRDNLMELTLGTDPKHFDAGVPFFFGSWGGYVRLNVRRPAGLQGWRHWFEVSEDMVHWRPTNVLDRLEFTEDNGDGTETFHVILTDCRISEHPQLYFRLVAFPAGMFP